MKATTITSIPIPMSCRAASRLLACVIPALFVQPAAATNGINLIGFGAESSLMAGADLAVARDTSALNTNPAGLAQATGRMMDAFGSVLRTFDLTHKDSFGNEKHANNRYTFLFGGGYAQPLAGRPCAAGIGMFAQGGAGGVYKPINTAFGTRDEMSSLFGIAKLTPGVGCKVDDALSLGASLSVVHASIDQKLFPQTSSVAPFAGYRLSDASATRVGAKLGLQYRLSPAVVVAAAYTAKTEVPLTGGELVANYSAMGLGKVRYRDARVEGFALPQEIGVGVAFEPSSEWLLSFKLNWINWADAVKTVTLRATRPTNPAAPASYEIVAPADWRNQWVFATGIAYRPDGRTTYYAGHNYGRSPIPAENSSPLLAGLLQHHVTLGAAWQLDPEWKLTGGLEYMLPVRETYRSPLFGEAELRNEAVFLHFMVSRRW